MTNDNSVPERERKRTTPQWSGIAALGAALTLAVLGIAACGTSTHPSTTTAAVSNAGLKYAQCMRANGVPNFPDPSASSNGSVAVYSSGSGDTLTANGVSVNAPAFRSAMVKCQKDLPAGHVSAARFAEISKDELAMAKCMRSHGVPTWPDPTVSDGPQGLIITGDLKAAHININAPAFQHAMKICQRLSGVPAPPTR